MTENFPNVAEDINLQIQEAEATPNRINPDTSTPNQTSVHNQISES